jgi:hypothetical protein
MDKKKFDRKEFDLMCKKRGLKGYRSKSNHSIVGVKFLKLSKHGNTEYASISYDSSGVPSESHPLMKENFLKCYEELPPLDNFHWYGESIDGVPSENGYKIMVEFLDNNPGAIPVSFETERDDNNFVTLRLLYKKLKGEGNYLF